MKIQITLLLATAVTSVSAAGQGCTWNGCGGDGTLSCGIWPVSSKQITPLEQLLGPKKREKKKEDKGVPALPIHFYPPRIPSAKTETSIYIIHLSIPDSSNSSLSLRISNLTMKIIVPLLLAVTAVSAEGGDSQWCTWNGYSGASSILCVSWPVSLLVMFLHYLLGPEKRRDKEEKRK